MVSAIARHMESTESTSPFKVTASRLVGAVDGNVKPSRVYYNLKYSYTINPTNGSETTVAESLFPSGNYDALASNPVWEGHRFVGWFPVESVPSTSIPSMDGVIVASDTVRYPVKEVFARWQLPATFSFDATTGGGVMPSDWVVPYYYAGQTFGTLPSPTHETLSFTGWYLNGTKVTAASVVPEGGGTLVAQYAAQSYSVDLNGAWEQNSADNPNFNLYDGVYQSFSNVDVDDSMAKMFIDVVGYTTFKILIASSSESNYDYTVAMEADIDPVDIPYDNWGGDASVGVKASTSSGYYYATPSVLGDYLEVVYNLDGGAHRICVLYRKDSSSRDGEDRGYLIIPKEQ